jgi:hypothetical protein
MSEEKVTADSYGKVDLSNKSNECWMLRIPPTLAAAWEDVPEGTVLGELVFRKGGKVPGRPTVKPELDIHADPSVAKNLPQTYSPDKPMAASRFMEPSLELPIYR